MRFSAERSALSDAVKAATIGGGFSPIMTGVRFDALDDSVRVTGSNGDLTCSTTVRADVSEVGTAIPSAALIGAFLGSTTAEVAVFEETSLGLTASSGDTVIVLRCHHPSMWPSVEAVEGEPTRLSADDIDAISRVTYAGIKDQKKRLIYPMYVSVHFVDRRAEATDRYRFAVADLEVDVPDIIVPLDTITRVVRGAEGDCELTTNGSRATFRCGSTSCTSSLIPGEFPALHSGLARIETPFHLTFSRDDLLSSLARVGLLDDSVHHVSLQRDGGKVILANAVLDVGEITDVVACEGDFDGAVILDRKMFAETLGAIDDDDVTLGLRSPSQPIRVITADSRYTHVIQPISVTSKVARG